LAWQEGLGGLGVDNLACTARRDGDGWQLDGTKRFVAGAAGATGFVVAARTEAGLGLFWVEAQAPGLELTHEWRADQTPSGVLALAGVRLGAEAALCAPGAAAAEAFERAFEDAVVLASAEMLGVMAASLEMTLAYMRTRVQFGKPIGSFQAMQHKATDLYVQQELTRAVLDEALRTLNGGAPADERARAASRCKARASDAGLRVTREVIQLSGAIGFTDEYDAGLYLKRALVLSAWLGNGAAHRQRFARLQRESAAAPGV
jgi:alkylation response protein AidB-like acyl-CoA dehydrogenase